MCEWLWRRHVEDVARCGIAACEAVATGPAALGASDDPNRMLTRGAAAPRL